MRHLKKGKKLGRTSAHRKALLSNLAVALFQNGRIETTLSKARALRPYAEKLITTGKKSTVAARREALKKLRRRVYVNHLFDQVAPRFASRNGGYTRIVKLPLWRVGDAGQRAVIELVD